LTKSSENGNIKHIKGDIRWINHNYQN